MECKPLFVGSSNGSMGVMGVRGVMGLNGGMCSVSSSLLVVETDLGGLWGYDGG